MSESDVLIKNLPVVETINTQTDHLLIDQPNAGTGLLPVAKLATAQDLEQTNAAIAAETSARNTAISTEVVQRNAAITVAVGAEAQARNLSETAISERVNALAEKVKDIELFKFPNASIIGSPTIQSGQISGFSTENYLAFPFIVDFEGYPFTIDFAITTSENVNSRQVIFDSDHGLALEIGNGHFVLRGSTDGQNWVSGVGVSTLSPMATVNGKVKWDGSILSLSIFDGSEYSQDIAFSFASQPFPRQIYIGGSPLNANYFEGSIDLNRAYLRVGAQEVIVWQGMDDAGLASRADVSLSNIDENGDLKIKSIVQPLLEAELAARGLAHLDANSAAAHNAIWRGKDLTNVYTIEEISARVQAGTFNDLYIGDYIRKAVTINGQTTTTNWRFMDFDYHINMGDTPTRGHHILIMPDNNLDGGDSHQGASYWLMNTSNTTSGGYVGSRMWGTHIPAIATGIKNAFGSAHVLRHREFLTKGVNASAPSGAGANYVGTTDDWGWYDVDVNLPNEPMVYGGRVFSSSAFDVSENKSQLAAFRLNHALTCNRVSWWLSAVASSTTFAYVSHYGIAHANGASYSWVGVRPYFLLV